jgi:putative salt-induced outer membrane protein YdiY
MKHCFLILYLMTSACSVLFGDTLIMQNGDRMTGEVAKKEGNHLTFKSDSAGTIEVKWAEVKELKTASPVKILFQNGTLIESAVILNREPAQPPKNDGSKKRADIDMSDIDIINPDPWEIGEGWQFTGRFNLGMKYERGDGHTDESDLDSKLTLRNLKNRFELDGEIEEDRKANIVTEDKWIFEGTYHRFFDEELYALAYVMGEQDRFSELSLRSGGGFGIGNQFLDTERVTFLTELLVGHMWEHYTQDPSEQYFGVGWSINLETQILRNHLTFYFEHNGFWDTEKSQKVFTKTWMGLRVPLAARISGTLEVKHEFDSGHAPNTEETDWTQTLKLGYEW